jgi:hypothetical protein
VGKDFSEDFSYCGDSSPKWSGLDFKELRNNRFALAQVITLCLLMLSHNFQQAVFDALP